jgi:hypothetical protein
MQYSVILLLMLTFDATVHSYSFAKSVSGMSGTRILQLSSVNSKPRNLKASPLLSCADQESRRLFLKNALFVGVSFALSRPSYGNAEDGPEVICTNILGCPIPAGGLRAPKRIYKDIFEEERDLARQAAEKAEMERMERRQSEILVVKAQFAVVKKGLVDMRKDIGDVISEAQKTPDNETAWVDLRRLARLYDTALRKDGMDLALNNIKKLKIEFDIKAAEAGANALTDALKGLDKAGKKNDVELSKSRFSEATQAVESWLQLESQLNEKKS